MTTPATDALPLWKDTSSTPAERAASLVQQMTLREKLQQIGSTWPGSEDLEEAVAPLQETHEMALPFEEAIIDGIGHITRPFGTAPVEPAAGIARLVGLQRRVVDANRFGIPAIAHEECLTGLTAWKATVYPTPLAWAATFHPDLVKEMGEAIGTDMAALGVHQGLAPVLDVVRDYRWGRVEETLGEDPYLVSELAAAYVRGIQSAGIIATLKHFVGYSASRGARNHAPVSIGQRELRDVMLPPFEKAVVAAGVRSVMNSYTELDGVPTASDRELLTGLLRDQWGFTGTVVSDYWATPFLQTMHRVADGLVSAGALSLTAGIDVELPHTASYTEELAERVDVDFIDTAATRILTQKAELGLLDEDWTPERDHSVDLDSTRNRDIAARLAEESVVLLRNTDALLPLSDEPRRVAVIGPLADDPHGLFGCYSFPNHVLPNFPEAGLGISAPSVLQGIREAFPNAEVTFIAGGTVIGHDTANIPAAVAAAAAADLTMVVVGDRSGMFGHGTSGEGCDVLGLELPGSQHELTERVLEAAGTSILIVLSGRPYAIGPLVEQATSALQVFFPGQEGAAAIAGVLTGRVDPSGRMPVQIPGTSSAQPGTYLAPPLALRSEGISNIDPTPAFPFGFGLSYTDLVFGPLQVDAERITTDGTVTVSTTVENRGTRAGTAVPQLYLHDVEADVTRPVRQLIGFTRLLLQAGESAEVSFTMHADLTAYTDRALRRRVDAGLIELSIAENAAGAAPIVTVELTGPVRYVDHQREMTTYAAVRSSIRSGNA
ncbi:glycoside hydrolase family 3 C-terminal domain-containing protein [Rathayibacter sp. VKM Ac-2929]|uniref:beta-glucosidase family protein n=1 Tax=Rathayibacter sp. VKM Ac-2929 TaxID=2929480 RepID=UPI001FB2F3FA|nr:glycoside hydrolase family 3 N-terminal domain-containing protein [Rathayibacter sp. VKM Ac-2929]MCJ1675526.1 glycoside hydrolase family 3 C-terminal domain-containing protein [Rathayibacter sp. VKM Ac-2929]